ncbi:hypothetical protein WR25_18252 [Diploscapter pachys]|uniref:HECT-type E3 ubiquitin transferase n=1 Tax=Diploscapter pachys TaxID=2018661 RepID=A0A2A2KVU7_9BILA|nr:hypothetical protein WR25_18252 [Diploscapter pachys]
MDGDRTSFSKANLSVTDKRNLCILRNIPFIVPFSQRIKIFHDLLEFEKQNVPDTGFDEGSARNLTTVSIRRHELYEDAFAQLGDCNKVDLRQKIAVRMINMHGIQERGVDGGGIFRDFLTELLKTGLDPSRGFFTYTHDRLLYPNPVAMNIYAAEYWRHFHFLGRMLAKLIRMKMMAEIRFAEFFIAQLLGQSRESCIDLHHMLGYDPELYRHLKNLLHYSEEEIENLQLDFSILVEELGSVRKMDLKPGGSNIPVTIANRQEFVRLYVNYYLFQRIEPMVLAMRDGVSSVLSIEWLAMFSPTELQTLVSGIEGPIDVADMRRNCLVYHIRNEADDAYARMFWEVVEAMSPGDQRLLLKFVTGCSRPPIEGFSQLEPKMGITLVDKDPEALPTSATCMNLLTLPKYSSRARLEEKLRGPESSRTSVRGLQLLVRLDEVHVRDPLADQLRDAVADVDLQYCSFKTISRKNNLEIVIAEVEEDDLELAPVVGIDHPGTDIDRVLRCQRRAGRHATVVAQGQFHLQTRRDHRAA